jgi:hypothetical protein
MLPNAADMLNISRPHATWYRNGGNDMKILFAAISIGVITWLIATGRSLIASADDSKKADALVEAKVKYAEAMVSVAEATLRRAQQANRQAGGAEFPASVVQSLQNDLAMAKARVRFFQDGGSGGSEAPYRAAARDSLSAAELSLKQAADVNSRVQGTIDNAELARRQAQVELAKARLDVCQQLDLEKATGEQRMQWEIMLLQEDIHELRSEIEVLKHRN